GAASSAYANAPRSAITPPAAHAPMMNSGVWTWRATTYGLMKMPDPMIPPITIIVASKAPRRRASAATEIGILSKTPVATAEIQSNRPEDRRRFHRIHLDQALPAQ